MYFYILFYLHILKKNTNNVTRKILPSGLFGLLKDFGALPYVHP